MLGLRRQGPGFGDRRKAMLGDIAVLPAAFIAEDLGRTLEASSCPSWAGPRRSPSPDDTTIIQGRQAGDQGPRHQIKAHRQVHQR
jgi:hypothetical protein